MRDKTKKRGEELGLWFMIEIFAAALVVYILISVAQSYGSYDVFDQMRVSRELAMEINALNAVHGDAYLVNDDVSRYRVRFNRDSVNIFGEKSDILGSSYAFVNNKNSVLDYSVNYPHNLVLIKQGGRISIDTNVRERAIISDFPLMDTKDTGWTKKAILIDPGHGGNPDNIREPGDFGYINDDLKESKITFDIARSLAQLMANVRLTRESDEYNPAIDKRMEMINELAPDETTEIAIILHVGSRDDESNEIIAYVNHESTKSIQSRKLASFILKEMAGKFDTTDVRVIPLIMDDLDKTDSKRMLDNNKIAVYLEIGNIKSIKGSNMLRNNIPQLINSIKGGVSHYFGDID